MTALVRDRFHRAPHGMSDPVLTALQEIVRAVRESSASDRYLDVRGVASVLSYSYNYTANKVVHLPDFPQPLRMGDGHARWLKSKVIQWGEARAEKRKIQ